MNRPTRRRQARERHFRVEAVPRGSPDLHKLAQMFLGMAMARAQNQNVQDATDTEPGRVEPETIE